MRGNLRSPCSITMRFQNKRAPEGALSQLPLSRQSW